MDCLGDFCVSTDGNSGAIKVSRGDSMKEVNQTVRMNFHEIVERDGDGMVVGKTGSKSEKHSFKTFAGLEFTFSDLQSTTVNVRIIRMCDVHEALFLLFRCTRSKRKKKKEFYSY